MTPRVAVIIPTKNRSGYLVGAITSVLNQSFEDLDIVVVDDASEDATEEVVRSFQDRRVRYIRHSVSKGGSATRNTGIRQTSSPLVAFLDDDDEWLPQKLELQLKLMDTRSDNVGCVYSGYEIFDKDLKRKLAVRTPCHNGDLRRVLLEGNSLGTTSTVLVRRMYLTKSGLFDETLPSMQDYDLYLRLAQVCDFEYIDQALVRYRMNASCISTYLPGLEKGLRKLIQKHGGPPILKRTCSRLLLDVGVRYAEAGQMRDASRVLAFTVFLNPTDLTSYFYLASASLGQKGYRRVQLMKQTILSGVRRHSGEKSGA
ncbi:MAG: glycosyl transferase [Acidobacteria bacterium]|nr:MAG: glycosyl transferase [Acidobacteriota bacterium]